MRLALVRNLSYNLIRVGLLLSHTGICHASQSSPRVASNTLVRRLRRLTHE